MNKSFKLKLATYFCIVILIASAAVGAVLSVMSAQTIGDIRNETSERIADETAETITNYMAGYSNVISMMSLDSNVNGTPFRNQSSPWLLRAFRNLIRSYREISYVYVGYDDLSNFANNERLVEFEQFKDDEFTAQEGLYNSKKGFYVYPHFKAAEDYQPKKRGWYELALTSDEIVWTDTYIDAFTGLPVITVAKQFKNSSNQTVGVVGADIMLNTLSAKYSGVEIGNTGYIFIVDSAGNVISHPEEAQLGTNIDQKSFWAEMKSKESGYINYSVDGVKKYLYFKTEPESGWKIAVPFENSEVLADTRPLMINAVLIIVACLILGAAVAIYIASRITKDINLVNRVLSKVSEGNLTDKVNLSRKDEIGQMSQNLNRTIDVLQELIQNIKSGSRNVMENSETLNHVMMENLSATEEITSSVQDIANGTNEQAEDVAASSEIALELSEKTEELVSKSEEMGSLSDNVSTESKKGLEVVNSLISKNSTKEVSSKELSNVIKNVDEQSNRINDITETISDISAQTNLLALNASIEAARAGEAGRGFAVVAEEIRKLAEQSAEASENIKELINAMQEQSGKAVVTMEKTRKLEFEELEAIQETEQRFKDIFSNIESLVTKIEEVESANDGVSSGVKDLRERVTHVAAVSQQTSANSQTISASTEEQLASLNEIKHQSETLKNQAVDLENIVKQFTV